MTAWWLDNHSRLSEERACVYALEQSEAWLTNVEWSFNDSLQLCVAFEIELEHGTFQLVMTYHNTFPSSPPSLAPIDETRLSSHQYGSGDLCLEIRPDNWRSDYTGADMIRSAYKLLTIEAPDEEGLTHAAPSAHNVSETMAIRWEKCRFYITPSIKTVLFNGVPTNSEIEIRLNWTGDDAQYSIAHLVGVKSGDWTWSENEIPKSLQDSAILLKGTMIKSTLSSALFSDVEKIDHLNEVLERDSGICGDSRACIIVTSDNEVLLFQKSLTDDTLYKYQAIFSEYNDERRSGEEFVKLSECRVGIVGLGSLGSKIAIMLARAGIYSFVLVDDDVLHMENLERHDADWRDVGLHKVDAVSRRLKMISNKIQVSPRKTSIGAQVSTSEAGTTSAALDNCNLVVDATANSNVFNYLAGLVSRGSGTLVWGGVYAGGIGGYIARSRPKIDPDPFLIRDGINEYYSNIDTVPPVADNHDYDGRDEDGFLIASDADVSVIASHLSNYAIDALLESDPTQYDNHAYIIGLKQSWIFQEAFDVRPIKVDAPVRSATSEDLPSKAEVDFIKGLIEKKTDEANDRSEVH